MSARQRTPTDAAGNGGGDALNNAPAKPSRIGYIPRKTSSQKGSGNDSKRGSKAATPVIAAGSAAIAAAVPAIPAASAMNGADPPADAAAVEDDSSKTARKRQADGPVDVGEAGGGGINKEDANGNTILIDTSAKRRKV